MLRGCFGRWFVRNERGLPLEAPRDRRMTSTACDEVQGNPIKPPPDVVGVSARLDLADQTKECLLGDILGQRWIPRDRDEKPAQTS